jgi:uncharacterized protein with PIN domain
MNYVYFIGGFKHGDFEAVSQITPVMNFAVLLPVVTFFQTGEIGYKEVKYKYVGVLKTHYEDVHAYVYAYEDIAELEAEMSQFVKESKLTLDKLNELLQKAYLQPTIHQLIHEQHILSDRYNWLNAGLREARRERLCYWCAEEIIGPGFGKVNDLLVPKGSGKRVRSLVCGNCGRGKFNRRGERIGDWKSDEHLH